MPVSLLGEHWVEKSANEVRTRLGLRSFALRSDADRLMDLVIDRGVEVRIEPGIDCIGEIHSFRGRSRLKLSAGTDPALLADVAIHEISHHYTRSGMPGVCSPCFSWWWQFRDERYACLWSAHFRLPTGPLLALVRRGAGWEDLVAECQVPDGLLAFKLKTLGMHVRGQRPGPSLPELSLDLPTLASQRWRIEMAPEPGSPWQHRLGIVDRVTGERWAYRRAENPTRLEPSADAIAWDLVGSSVGRFWERWRDRLEPAQRIRLSNPKASWAGQPAPHALSDPYL